MRQVHRICCCKHVVSIVASSICHFVVAVWPTHASITIDSSSLTAHAQVIGSNPQSNTFSGTMLETNQALFAAAGNAIGGGNSFSSNEIDWSLSGEQVVLTLDILEHNRSGNASVSNVAKAGINLQNNATVPPTSITFTLSEPTEYLISGEYIVRGTQDNSGDSRFFADLSSDVGVPFFHSDQSNVLTKNVDYDFGVGDFTGSLSGTLPTGTYFWTFGAVISNTFQVSDGGATASGFFTLTLGQEGDTGPGIVPEATSFLVWGLLGLICCAGRRIVGTA